eukprot:2600773-Heterocapsa_arctica.AAC.1
MPWLRPAAGVLWVIAPRNSSHPTVTRSSSSSSSENMSQRSGLLDLRRYVLFLDLHRVVLLGSPGE